jgi:excisionase family DNA binding protein
MRSAPGSVRRRPARWLGLTEASSLLGVSPGTLRRWSDSGRVKAFTTPGGHRRFSRAALQRLLPAERQRRPAVVATALTGERLTRAYRRRLGHPAAPWLVTLDAQAVEGFRRRGIALAAALIRHLDAEPGPEQDQEIETAARLASEYGRACAASGLSLSQTVEGFLLFRAPFVAELAAAARRRGFDASEATDLLQAAEQAMDRLLVATMTGHGVRAAGVGRGTLHVPRTQRVGRSG